MTKLRLLIILAGILIAAPAVAEEGNAPATFVMLTVEAKNFSTVSQDFPSLSACESVKRKIENIYDQNNNATSVKLLTAMCVKQQQFSQTALLQ